MNPEEFELLATRVLTGDASATEKETLESLLAKDLDRHKEFEAMKVAHQAIRQGVPLVNAMEAKAPELPAWRLNELRDSVRQAFAHPAGEPVRDRSISFGWLSRGLLWGGAVAAVLLCLLIVPWGGPRRIEVAMYADYATRGPSRFAFLQQEQRVDVKQFQKDEAFEKWKRAPLPRNQSARIWIDDETNFIRARWWNARGKLQEACEALADDPRQQEAQLQAMIATIRRESGGR